MDRKYMLRAIELAVKGTGRTNPNPLVGAVIVKDGRIIGEGYHEKYGQLHAERNALANCRARGENPEGAAIYVTLEPCCHYGKTPPCTEAIIEHKLAKVIIGSRDPNPLVAGKGAAILREAGIEVVEDFMKTECDEINPVFFHFMTTGAPYVVMKYAMTMDGKIATHTGESKWITGEPARARVHEDRNRYTAIMCGTGTILKDNPLLTCRLPEGGRNPVRIICDSKLSTPGEALIVNTCSQARTIIATVCTDKTKQQPYLAKGCEILEIPATENGRIDLKILMQRLAEMNIDSILLEGGGTLNWSALEAGIVNKVQCYIAPKIFGGSQAKSPVAGTGVEFPAQAVKLTDQKITVIGEDILVESEVSQCSQES